MSGAPVVARGTCHVCFAADLGFAIDLEQAARLIPVDTARPSIRERRTPSHLGIEPSPLQVSVTAPSVRIEPAAIVGAGGVGGAAAVEPVETLPTAEFTLFDFGGALVTYRLPLSGPLDALVPLSEALYEHAGLAALARRQLGELAAQIGAAIDRPEASQVLEDYAIFHVAAFTEPLAPSTLLREHAATLAAILRGESKPLSAQEIAEAIAQSGSYRPHDLLIVDWNAAFAVDDDFDAIRTVLGFANVELVELRVVDGVLDGLVNRAYETLASRTWRDQVGMGRARHELRRIARLEMDVALVFEQVNNALKLFGDEYLARVYRLASRRLHLAEWDASVLRKLETIERIYDKVSDEQTNRRMELLEWIIIALIAWEVVWAFMR